MFSFPLFPLPPCRMNFRLCRDAKSLETYASRPEYIDHVQFSDNLIGVNLAKERVVLNKPIYIGQAVLDLSKLTMFRLHYETMAGYAKEYNGSISIMGGDTDSFFLKITDIDVENVLIPRLCKDNILDSSNYPHDHPQFSEVNKARLGCIKDEAGGKPFREWVLLRPKAYSMQTVDDRDNKMRAKGVCRSTLKLDITHETYKQAYTEQMTFSHTQRRFGTVNHQLYSMTYLKKTLSFFEDKRAWTAINSSLPYGNHRLLASGQQRDGQGPQKRKASLLPELVEPTAKRHCADS